jgi:hypothetical protein
VLAEVLHDLTPAIAQAGAAITADFTVPEIQFQKKNLRSIFYNLLTNAIKYQRPGVPPVVEVRTRPEGEYILLTIKDNGLGIRAATRKNSSGCSDASTPTWKAPALASTSSSASSKTTAATSRSKAKKGRGVRLKYT